MPEPIPTPTPDNAVSRVLDDHQINAWSNAVAKSAAAQVIAGSSLPEPAKARLSAQTWNSSQELQAAIEAERSYLAELSANSVVQIGGTAPRSSQISNMRTSLDRGELALEALHSGTRPPDGVAPLTGIRQLYHTLSGDYEMSGMNWKEFVEGTLVLAIPQLPLTIGNAVIAIRAEKNELFPNQFVNVRLRLDTLEEQTWIAQSAVQRGGRGLFVYVVREDMTVTARPVTLGPADGPRVAVLKGIEPASWQARGFVVTLMVPLIALAARRNPQWSLNVFVSRHVVFYTTSLIAVGAYLLLMAFGGYVIRLYGGTWGRAAQLVFLRSSSSSTPALISSARGRWCRSAWPRPRSACPMFRSRRR